MTLPTCRDRFDKPTRRQLLNQRLMARMLLASGGVWLAMLAFAAVASGANPKPNVIVIFTDDQTYRGIGYNNPEVKTPALDVSPTLLALAGADSPPQPLMGKSLLPLFKNPTAPIRETVFSECVGVGGKAGQGHRMARGERWKLILSDANEEFLFDLKEVTFELSNRRDDPDLAPTLAKHRQELADWMKSIGNRPYPMTANLKP